MPQLWRVVLLSEDWSEAVERDEHGLTPIRA